MSCYGEECCCARNEAPEHPRPPIRVCHCPSICHPTRLRFVIFLSPSARYLITHARSAPSNPPRYQFHKRPLDSLRGRRQDCHPGQHRNAPFILSIDVALDIPARLWTIATYSLCTLSSFFLSLVSFTFQYHTLPARLPVFSDDITACPRRPTRLHPRLLTAPIHSAYIPVSHPENGTIQRSNTGLHFRYLACI